MKKTTIAICLFSIFGCTKDAPKTSSAAAPQSNFVDTQRKTFFGTWTCYHTGTISGSTTYSVLIDTISVGIHPNAIQLKNLYNKGTGVSRSCDGTVESNGAAFSFGAFNDGAEVVGNGTGFKNNISEMSLRFYAYLSGSRVDTVTCKLVK